MELYRALAALAEAPTAELASLATRLGLGELPAGHAHTELFAFQLVPYASIYLGEEGLVGGDARDRILGFWRALGREPIAEGDHLSLMLASYAELCDRERSAASGDRGMLAAAQHHRAAFFREHLVSWLPPYLLRVRELGDPFYAAWAEMLEALLGSDARRTPPLAVEPMHFRLSRPLRVPDVVSDGGLPELLAALVAPVRSGFLLTRRDLSDAARELGIGTRMGERRYMLEAMLRQRPEEVIAWLIGYCERSLDAYARVPEALHESMQPWIGRATLTGESLTAVLARRGAAGAASGRSDHPRP